MDYTDFRLSASDLGSLVGLFGGNKQFISLCKIWEKSTYKQSYTKQGASVFSEEEASHVKLLGISEQWKRLRLRSSLCMSQDHIMCVNKDAFQILFQNEFIQRAVGRIVDKLTHASLSAEKIVDLLQVVIRDMQNSYKSLQLLQTKCDEYNCLGSVLSLLGMSSKLYYIIQQRCNRSYGNHGENKYISTFNELHEAQITRVFCTSSRTLVDDLVDGSTWCIDGRIDGLLRDRIIEIKHRTGVILDRIPLYEIMQLHAYMFLFNKTEASLVQCIQKKGLMYSEEVTVHFSHLFWKQMVAQLKKCILFIKLLHNNPLSRDCFLKLKSIERDEIMTQYIGRPIEYPAYLDK